MRRFRDFMRVVEMINLRNDFEEIVKDRDIDIPTFKDEQGLTTQMAEWVLANDGSLGESREELEDICSAYLELDKKA